MPDADPSLEQIAYTAKQVAARMERLGLDRKAISRAGGPTFITMQNLLERNIWIKKRDRRAALSLALGWQPDGLERLARGEEPLDLRDEDKLDHVDAELSRLAEIQAGQSEAIQGLQRQVTTLEGLIRSVLRAVEGKRSLRRRGESPPPDQPPS
jgi:hypothetical protein